MVPARPESSETTLTSRPNPSGRSFSLRLWRPRFALRTMLVITGLAAVAAAIAGRETWEYVAEQRLVDRFTDLGGSVATTETGTASWASRVAEWAGVEDFGQRVVALDLSGATVSERDIEAIQGFQLLQSLDLSGTNITDAWLHHLAAAKQLLTLQLNETAVTDSGLAHLKPGVQRLIETADTAITFAGLAPFGQSSVDARLSHCLRPGAFRQDGRYEAYLFLRSGQLGGLEDLARFRCRLPELCIWVHADDDVANPRVIKLLAQVPRLVSLHAQTAILNDRDMAALIEHPALREVRIFHAPLTSKCLTDLSTLPALEILHLPESARPEDIGTFPPLEQLQELLFFPEESPAATNDL